MVDIDRTKSVPGRHGTDPDLRVYNVVARIGYVESARHAPLIFQHEVGFSDYREALLHLHESLDKTLKKCVEYKTWREVEEDTWYERGPTFNCNIQQFLWELQPSDNDGSPAGYEAWEELSCYGWNYAGHLVTGVCVGIDESAEVILADSDLINKHCDAFEGKFHPLHGEGDWPMTSDIRLDILIVSKIPAKEILRPQR